MKLSTSYKEAVKALKEAKRVLRKLKISNGDSFDALRVMGSIYKAEWVPGGLNVSRSRYKLGNGARSIWSLALEQGGYQ